MGPRTEPPSNGVSTSPLVATLSPVVVTPSRCLGSRLVVTLRLGVSEVGRAVGLRCLVVTASAFTGRALSAGAVVGTVVRALVAVTGAIAIVHRLALLVLGSGVVARASGLAFRLPSS